MLRPEAALDRAAAWAAGTAGAMVRRARRARKVALGLWHAFVAPIVFAWSLRWFLAVLVAFAGGWGLVTWGIARLLVPEVWLISGGLFLLALVGWGLIRDIVTEGLPVLVRAYLKGRTRG